MWDNDINKDCMFYDCWVDGNATYHICELYGHGIQRFLGGGDCDDNCKGCSFYIKKDHIKDIVRKQLGICIDKQDNAEK